MKKQSFILGTIGGLILLLASLVSPPHPHTSVYQTPFLLQPSRLVDSFLSTASYQEKWKEIVTPSPKGLDIPWPSFTALRILPDSVLQQFAGYAGKANFSLVIPEAYV
ncbi:MAG: hypothetical protein AAGI38_21905, partial [Bacteroidota bacterium]